MSEVRFDAKRDGLGIVLFTAGAFVSVLMLKALASGAAAADGGGTAALARLWTASLGGVPSLLFTAGITVLGARLFLQGRGGSLLRNAGGLACASAGLAVLLGSFSETAGGALGDVTGGSVARWTHALVGGLIGLAALVAPIWILWLRPPGSRWGAGALGAGGEDAIGARESIPGTDEGISAEEAAALVPEAMPHPLKEIRKQWTPSALSAPATASALSLAPSSDVRLRGEVPAGARALESEHVLARPEVSFADAPVHHWTAPRPGEAGDPPDPDLAVAAAEPEPVLERAERIFAAPEVEEEEIDLTAAELRSPEFDEGSAAEETDATPAGGEDEVPPSVGAEGARELAPVPTPSWEQTSLFELGEEPVDAYGTPVALVEELRRPAEISATTGASSRSDEAPQAAGASPRSDEDQKAEGAEPRSDEDPEAAEDHPTSAGGDVDEASEPDVVLVPKASHPKRAPTISKSAAGRAKLLAEAGDLFLDQGRVAVSMLQKQYGMDFEEACKVLDELQDMGLIGPYLGGQRRDILLTREEWSERVSALG